MDSGSYLAERNSAVVQVRVSCSDRAPNINTMTNNISHLLMDDGVVVMADEAAASLVGEDSCRRGPLVDQRPPNTLRAQLMRRLFQHQEVRSICLGTILHKRSTFVHLNIRSLLP